MRSQHGRLPDPTPGVGSDDESAAAADVVERTALHAQLTGASQGWLRVVADTRPGGVAALQNLLLDTGDHYAALTESGPRIGAQAVGTSRPKDDDILADEAPDDSTDLSAARSIVAVAIGTCDHEQWEKLRPTATRHWVRSRLPAFDGELPFPARIFTGVDPAARRFLAAVESGTPVPCRGFLALLALELLGARLPPRRRLWSSVRVEVPVLFDRQLVGGAGVLRLELLEGGPAGLHPAPATMGFFHGDGSFAESVRRAWVNSPLPSARECVVWSVRVGEAPCNIIEQGSLGGAFAVGLHELDRLRRRRGRLSPFVLDGNATVTGSLDERARRMLFVGGYEHKFAAARAAGLRRIVVPEESLRRDDFPPVPARLRIVGVDTVRQAVRQTRRRPNPAYLAGVIALIVAVTAGILVNATSNRRADAERNVEFAAQRTVARDLVARADDVRQNDPRLALQLGVAAFDVTSDEGIRAAATSSLLETLTTPHHLGESMIHSGSVVRGAFSPNGQMLATGSGDGTVWLWDVSSPVRAHPLGDPLTNQGGTVAFSPNGHVLAGSRAADDAVWLWDVTDPSQPHRLGEAMPGHTDTVWTNAFSPNGQVLATGGLDGTVRLWDVADPARPSPLGEPITGLSAVLTLAFSPDGRMLATGGDSNARLWDLTDPAHVRPLADPLEHTYSSDGRAWAEIVWSAEFSPDGHVLATSTEADDGNVRLWDVSDPTRPSLLGEPLTGLGDFMTDVAFSPDGRVLASGGSEVQLWDVTNLAQPHKLGAPLDGHHGLVNLVAFSPEGILVTGSSDETAQLWDLGSVAWPLPLDEFRTGRGELSASSSVIFSPSGVVVATVAGTINRALRLWDVSDPTSPRPRGEPLSVEAVPQSHSPAGYNVVSAAFSPDGEVLATGSFGGVVRLWDATDATQLRPLGEPLAGQDWVVSVAFAPDGRTLASGGSSDGTTRLWDVSDPASPRSLGELPAGHTGPVGFLGDGDVLATGASNGTVQLWNVADPANPLPLGAPLAGHTHAVLTLAYSPAASLLATGGEDGTVQVWDVSDPAQPSRRGQQFTAHPDSWVWSVAFSPDGRMLATGGDDGSSSAGSERRFDGTVRLWDVSDPTRARPMGVPLVGVTLPAHTVAFSPDSRMLATGGASPTAALWDITPITDLREDVVARACSQAGVGLDSDQWETYVPSLPFHRTCSG